MSDRPEKLDELRSLLNALSDGALDADGRAALSAMLSADTAARRYYLKHMALHAAMALRMSTALRPMLMPAALPALIVEPPAGGRPIARIRPTRWVAAAAVLILAAAAVAIWLGLFNRQSAIDNRQSPSALIATVIETTGNLIVGESIADAGAEISAGDITLDTGSAEFRLSNGVNVSLRGATQLTVHDTMSATLTRGSATFDCPPAAKGYTVHLPGGTQVVDLGTAFTVNAADDGVNTVTVEDGRVQITGRITPRSILLSAGDLVIVDTGRGRIVGPVGGAALLDRNLVVNGGFEVGPHPTVTSGRLPDTHITGWVDATAATAVAYEQARPYNYPDPSKHVVPDDAGRFFFVGCVPGATHQTIDLADAADAIDAGLIAYRLSGWLGGYYGDHDRGELRAVFLDATGETLAAVALGPIGAAERRAAWGLDEHGLAPTGLLAQAADGDAPVGARAVRIELVTLPGKGLVDFYADDIRLTLNLRVPRREPEHDPTTDTDRENASKGDSR